MKTEAIIFIHPNDFLRLLREPGGPIDVIIHSWPDGLKVFQIHGAWGIPYRITTQVPEVLTDEHYPDIVKDPPSERYKNMIYGSVAEESDWLERDAAFTADFLAKYPNLDEDNIPEMEKALKL